MACSNCTLCPDLLCYLTHYELGQCLDGPDSSRPRLLGKAIRRRQLFPQWDNNYFPEMLTGSPALVEAGRRVEAVKEAGLEGVRVRGTPACPGEVRGPARVVTHLSQADKIRPGDVLVTHSTGNTHGTVGQLGVIRQRQQDKWIREGFKKSSKKCGIPPPPRYGKFHIFSLIFLTPP